jgi:hypothetical protein
MEDAAPRRHGCFGWAVAIALSRCGSVVALQVLKMSILRVAFMLKGVGLSQKRGFFPIGARFSGFHPVLRRREAWSVELFIVASDGKQ